jgi:hypothetical protein
MSFPSFQGAGKGRVPQALRAPVRVHPAAPEQGDQAVRGQILKFQFNNHHI